MPLFPVSPAAGAVPVFNSACPWASSAEDLTALYSSPHTGAVTTRTATLDGFADDQTKHQVAFFGPDAQSSSNSYGYSPYPLEQYIEWLAPLIKDERLKKKQVIVSITGTLQETKTMLVRLQAFADEMQIKLAVEFNASCPNFKGHPPPAYVESELIEYVQLLATHSSPTLLPGIKLPPYTYESQFGVVVRSLSSVSPASPAPHPIAFLTATNTLGQGLVFAEQIVELPSSSVAQKAKPSETYALPGGIGGLAGAHIHNLSLGNVHKLRTLLDASEDLTLRDVSIIGVGGVADARGVERMRIAGASAVACASALGREGVEVFAKLSGN